MRAIVQYYSDDDEVEKIIICIDCIVVYYRPLFYLLIIPGTTKLLCTRYRWYFMIRGEGTGLDVLVRFKDRGYWVNYPGPWDQAGRRVTKL